MLHPGEVGVALGRDAELPAHVVVLAEPVGVVEGRVGEDVVGAEVGMEVAAEGVGVLGAEVGLDAAQGEVHDGEAAGGGVALLAVDADVAELAAVGFDEFFRLHEHAAGAAGGVVDAAFVGGEHLDEAAHDAGRGVELAAVLALGAGEAGEEILVDAAEQIDGAVGLLALAGGGECDGGDEVDEFAEALLVEAGAGVVLGQDAFEARVVALDGDHGVVHGLADGGLLGAGLEVGPAGIGGHPEDVLGFVFVRVFGIGPGVVALAGEELGAVFLEGVGDVFEEDEAEDDVLVFRRVHVVAQLVGGEPELGLEADGGRAGVAGWFAGHGQGSVPALPERSRRSAEGRIQIIGEARCAERLKQPKRRTKPAVSAERDLWSARRQTPDPGKRKTPIQLCWKGGVDGLNGGSRAPGANGALGDR